MRAGLEARDPELRQSPLEVCAGGCLEAIAKVGGREKVRLLQHVAIEGVPRRPESLVTADKMKIFVPHTFGVALERRPGSGEAPEVEVADAGGLHGWRPIMRGCFDDRRCLLQVRLGEAGDQPVGAAKNGGRCPQEAGRQRLVGTMPRPRDVDGVVEEKGELLGSVEVGCVVPRERDQLVEMFLIVIAAMGLPVVQTRGLDQRRVIQEKHQASSVRRTPSKTWWNISVVRRPVFVL